ncbi:MAG: glycoside hydrolase family 3 protein [Syntrophales bacterium]|nr:glycoside hydrolase family 3 protein [Syntrophales bacterium]
MKFLVRVLLVFLLAVGVSLESRAEEPDLKRKIGQMIMVGFRGVSIDEESRITHDIEAGRLGGVILFDYDVPRGIFERNIHSPEQLKRLTGQLQSRAAVPLFVAVDQEGGRVSRLKERRGFPPSPSQRFLGRLDDPVVTTDAAVMTARTLVDAGVNLNIAPVVDLDVNPDNPVIGAPERSFSSDPAVVARNAAIVIGVFREAGILSAVKHFPGHGSSEADTHGGFVDVTDLWSERELLPFRDLIEGGLVDMVMTAHTFNGRVDPLFPATLSERTIGGILREQLGYDGVVISDDLQMAAIRDTYSFEETLEKALKAGIDILLFANNSVYDEEVALEAGAVIARLVERGVVSPERIDESWRRIMKLKERL